MADIHKSFNAREYLQNLDLFSPWPRLAAAPSANGVCQSLSEKTSAVKVNNLASGALYDSGGRPAFWQI